MEPVVRSAMANHFRGDSSFFMISLNRMAVVTILKLPNTMYVAGSMNRCKATPKLLLTQ